MDTNNITVNMILVQFMSIGGKVGVNIFFMISAFFMISSSVKWIKVVKLIAQILFYNILSFFLLMLLGYEYGIKDYLNIFPLVFSIPMSFIGSYLVIYLLSPIINKLLCSLSHREFIYLLIVLLSYFSLLQSFFLQNTWHYLGWAFTMYCIGGYIKLYKISCKKYPYGMILILLIFSVWGIILLLDLCGLGKYWTFFIADANKINILALSVILFLFFLNIHIGYKKIINVVASASFGVLLLHANNEIMLQWLWKDFLKNTSYYGTNYLWIHMFASVCCIYIVCTILELLRQKFIEKPLFERLKVVNNQ